MRVKDFLRHVNEKVLINGSPVTLACNLDLYSTVTFRLYHAPYWEGTSFEVLCASRYYVGGIEQNIWEYPSASRVRGWRDGFGTAWNRAYPGIKNAIGSTRIRLSASDLGLHNHFVFDHFGNVANPFGLVISPYLSFDNDGEVVAR